MGKHFKVSQASYTASTRTCPFDRLQCSGLEGQLGTIDTEIYLGCDVKMCCGIDDVADVCTLVFPRQVPNAEAKRANFFAACFSHRKNGSF